MTKEVKHGLSRRFIDKAILGLLDEAESKKKWGCIYINFQAGVFKMIKKEETITRESE